MRWKLRAKIYLDRRLSSYWTCFQRNKQRMKLYQVMFSKQGLRRRSWNRVQDDDLQWWYNIISSHCQLIERWDIVFRQCNLRLTMLSKKSSCIPFAILFSHIRCERYSRRKSFRDHWGSVKRIIESTTLSVCTNCKSRIFSESGS